MKILLIVLMGMLISSSVMASNIDDQLSQFDDTILHGDNENAPTLLGLYVAKTIEDVQIPVVGECNWRTKLSYTSDINSIRSNQSIKLETGLEF